VVGCAGDTVRYCAVLCGWSGGRWASIGSVSIAERASLDRCHVPNSLPTWVMFSIAGCLFARARHVRVAMGRVCVASCSAERLRAAEPLVTAYGIQDSMVICSQRIFPRSLCGVGAGGRACLSVV
jgi:hypothetical protein